MICGKVGRGLNRVLKSVNVESEICTGIKIEPAIELILYLLSIPPSTPLTSVYENVISFGLDLPSKKVSFTYNLLLEDEDPANFILPNKSNLPSLASMVTPGPTSIVKSLGT